MQFKVPQFLEIEDKIFGPFTFRQFVYLAGGAGLCYVLFRILGLWLSIIPILLVAIFAALLTWYRPNDKPFVNMVEAGFKYAFQSKLYIWQRRKVRGEKLEVRDEKEKVHRQEQKLTSSKLRDLAWSLDVLDLKREGKVN